MPGLIEKFVNKLIVEQLAKWVRIEKGVEISILKGYVKIENVELLPSAFEALNLPIIIKRGFVRKIHVKFGVQSFLHSPIIVNVEELLLVLAPDDQWDQQKEAKRQAAVKQSKLNADDVVRKFVRDSFVYGKTAAPVELPKIVERIVDNLQVNLSFIHVAYEDHFTTPDHPFVAGVMLPSLVLRPGDRRDKNALFKNLEIDRLCVYWNADRHFHSVEALGPEQVLHHLSHAVHTCGLPQGASEGPPMRYILSPLSCKVEFAKRGRLAAKLTKELIASGEPIATVRISAPDVHLDVDPSQIDAIKRFADFVTQTEKFFKRRERRPRHFLRMRGDGGHSIRGWWRYAILTILDAIRHRNRKWNWFNLLQQRADRDRYVDTRIRLYREGEFFDAVYTECQAICKEIEDRNSFQQILFFRNISDLELIRSFRDLPMDPRLEKQQLKQIAHFQAGDVSRRESGVVEGEGGEGGGGGGRRRGRSLWRKLKDALKSRKSRSRSRHRSRSAGALRDSDAEGLLGQGQQQQHIAFGGDGGGGEAGGQRGSLPGRARNASLSELGFGRTSSQGGPRPITPSLQNFDAGSSHGGHGVVATVEDLQARLLQRAKTLRKYASKTSESRAKSIKKLKEADDDARMAGVATAKQMFDMAEDIMQRVQGHFAQSTRTMSPQELRQFLQDTVYPDYAAAMEEFYSFNLKDPLDAAGGSSYSKVRLEIHLQTVNLMLFEKPRQKLLQKGRRSTIPHPNSTGLRGWARLKKLIPALLDRFPDREARNRMCKIELGGVNMQVRMKLAGVTEVSIALDDLCVRDLVFGHYWGVLAEIRRDVESAPPYVRLEVVASDSLAEIDIKAHHIKGVYSRFVAVLIALMQPSTPGARGDIRFHDGMRASLNQTIRQSAAETLGQMLSKVNVILRLEALNIHGFIPEESYLSVPAHERHTLLPGGWGKSDALLMIGDVDRFLCEVHLVPKDMGRDGQRHAPVDPTTASVLNRIKRGAVKESNQELIFNTVVLSFTGCDGYLCRASEWRGEPTRREKRFQLAERFDFKVEIYQPLHWKSQSLRVTFPERVRLRISVQQFKAMLALIKSIQIGQKTARVYGFNSWMHVFNIMRDFKGDAGMYQAITVVLGEGAEICIYNESEDQLGVFVRQTRVDIVSYQRTQQIRLPVQAARIYCWSRLRGAWETMLEHFDGQVKVDIDVKSAGGEDSDRKYPSTRVFVAPCEAHKLPLRAEHLEPFGAGAGSPFIHPANYVPPFAYLEAAEFGGGKAAREAFLAKMAARARRGAPTPQELAALAPSARRRSSAGSAATLPRGMSAGTAPLSLTMSGRSGRSDDYAEEEEEEVVAVETGEEALAVGTQQQYHQGRQSHHSDQSHQNHHHQQQQQYRAIEPASPRAPAEPEFPPEDGPARVCVNANLPMGLVLADLSSDWQASSREWEILRTPYQVPPYYVVRNETRETILACLPAGWSQTPSQWTQLLPGSSMSLPFGQTRYRRFDPALMGPDGREGPDLAVLLQLNGELGRLGARTLPMYRPGTYVAPFSEIDTDLVGVVTVSEPSPERLVTVTLAVRSCVTLRNDLEYPVEIEVAVDNANAHHNAPQRSAAVLQPGAHLSLPLAAAARGSGAALLLRPAGPSAAAAYWALARVPLEPLRQPAAAAQAVTFEARGGIPPYAPPGQRPRTPAPPVRAKTPSAANHTGHGLLQSIPGTAAIQSMARNFQHAVASDFSKAMAALGMGEHASSTTPDGLSTQPSAAGHGEGPPNPALCAPHLGLVLCPQPPAPHHALPGRPPVCGPPLVLALAPPVLLRNLLPLDLEFALVGRDQALLGPPARLAAGATHPVSACGPVAAILRALGSSPWSEPLWLSGPDAGRQESCVVPTGGDGPGHAGPCLASVLQRREAGPGRERCLEVVLCVPYYFVNDTGLVLRVAAAEAVESTKGRPRDADVREVNPAVGAEEGAGPAPGAIHCGDRVRLGLLDDEGVGHWSEPLSLDKKVKAGTLLLHTPAGTYCFGVTIEDGPGPLLKSLTKVVTLVPRFVLVNQLKSQAELALANRAASPDHEPSAEEQLPPLVPQAIYPVYETLPGDELRVRIGGYDWSGPFPFDPTGADREHPTEPTPPPREGAAALRAEVLRSGCHLLQLRRLGGARSSSLGARGRRASLMADLDITRRIVEQEKGWARPPRGVGSRQVSKRASGGAAGFSPESPRTPATRQRRASITLSPGMAKAAGVEPGGAGETPRPANSFGYGAGGDVPVRVVRANVHVKKATVFITLVEEVEHQCTLQLENKTAEVTVGERPRNGLSLLYRQAPPGGEGDEEDVNPTSWDVLEPNKILPFGWERPGEHPRRLQLALRGRDGSAASGVVTLDWNETHEGTELPRPRAERSLLGAGSSALFFSLKFDAKGSKILRVFREKRRRPGGDDEEEDDQGFFSRRMRLEVFVDVDAAALSVSDHGPALGGHPRPRELLVVTVDGFRLVNDKWAQRQETKMQLARLQIHNAAGGGAHAPCPVLLGPVLRRFESWRPFIEMEILQYSTACRHYPPPTLAAYAIGGDRGEIKALRYQDSLMDTKASTRIVANVQPLEPLSPIYAPASIGPALSYRAGPVSV
eukprot:tig00000459_g1113.t1